MTIGQTLQVAEETGSDSRRAYQALERMLVTLELAPGSTTTEGALIERVGLGRTPVREAIQHLSWEGLLEIRPRAGIAVAPLRAQDWVKVLDARLGLEIVLARSAALHRQPEAADPFHAAARAMEEAAACSDVEGFLRADKAFDDALSAAADNPFAARLAAPLQTHSRRFWFRYKADTGLAQSAARHVALIRSILAHDPNGAEDRARDLIGLLCAHAEAAAGQDRG